MIYIACALHCEAKPLVEFYKLKLDRTAVYPIFSNEFMSLVVTGMGKLVTAAAISYLYAHSKEVKNAAWLNIGIAGHASHEVGTLLNIAKITDSNTGQNFYPARLYGVKGISSILTTVEQYNSFYPDGMTLDMEAAAFMSVVQKFTLLDMVQILKVVSDNQSHSTEEINKSFVSDIIQKNLDGIDETIQVLSSRQTEFAKINQYDLFDTIDFDRWHFSQYQQKELEKLLKKINALGISISAESLEPCKDGKSVLAYLQQRAGEKTIEF